MWREPGARRRVFGPFGRTPRGIAAFLLRPRRFATFRAHVLAVEIALAPRLASWELVPAGDAHRDDVPSWLLLARLNELASGVRRLVGEPEW
jgi:hypothetical protein